ncbi:unnamed protein product [Coregonus sp. 'balchen']|nr:unnamed protein product [Coregonus sp. 'balchen']
MYSTTSLSSLFVHLPIIAVSFFVFKKGYQGGTSPLRSYVSQHASKSDPAVLNHPAIKRFLESPSRSSSPLDQGSDTHTLSPSDSKSLSQQGEGPDWEVAWREDRGRNTRKDTFGVPSSVVGEPRVTNHTTRDEASRLCVRKTIVSPRYIPPDKHEEND